uniref:Putative u4/u6-associated splicing factor prp4 n=1 Tax=Amblyomma aureolatum TaxID=187763 RepID=A0A1E1XCY5_9ACAR
MSSSSSIRELPPGDPELTASIVSHLKSRGLFDKLRRDCLGDVDTKPAYLNLKQRIEGYITKFLSTQTWTPDMNKNHVRDMMRREINESGMLSAGMDHLVDQIVNPKIYQVFTPEVENGVRQYLGLSSAKDSSTQQPAPEAAADTISQPPPQTPALPPPPPPPPPPLPPKSEFSIDETTQDVPGSCSPKPYIEAFTPDDFTNSSSEPHLMIVTDNSERTEELPAELPFEEAASADLCDTSAEPVEPVPNETAGELPAPEQTDAMETELQVICPSGNPGDRLPAEDVVFESSVPLDDVKSDLLSEIKPIEIDKKDGEMLADMTKKEVKPMDKDRKERKLDSGKGRESNFHSSRSELHSKAHVSKKDTLVNRSKPHKSRGDGDLTRERRECRDKGSSSKVDTSKNKTDASKDERSKGYSSQSSRSKESDSRSERKRSDDRHRNYTSSQAHDDKKRHSDKHSREEKPRDCSDSRRSHSESRKDKGKSSAKVSSKQHKPSKSSEKHGESSQKDKGHEKDRKGYSRQNSSDSRDGGASKKASSERTIQPMCHYSFQAHDSTSCHVDMPETSIQERLVEMHTNSYDSSQLSFQSASQDSSLGMVEDVAQTASKEDILNGANQSETTVDMQATEEIFRETLSETCDECSGGALQLVDAKEAEILRFSYVTDKASGNSGIDLQLVDTVTEEQPQAVYNKEPVMEANAQLENGNEKSGPNDAALDVPEQESRLKEEKHEATRRKTTTEKNSPEKKRLRREASDGHESDGAWSDVTVSSVHTSDLSSYDDRISVSSAEEDDCAIVREKKKIPLREIKKMTSSSNEDDDRMSRSETEPPACDRAVPLPVVPEEVAECEPTLSKELKPPCPGPHQSSNTEKASRLSSSPSTVISDGVPKPKMGLRRTRKINPKYVSEEFSSIFTEGKRPAGTIDFSELAKYGKERHHEEQSSLRVEPRKVSSREDAVDDLGAPMSCDETDQFSDASVSDRSRRPARRPSGSEPRPRSESTSSKRYQSSDLYKPRPVIPSRSRRSRPSPTGQDLKGCLGAKQGRPCTAGSSRGKRL